jgi:hypothetical protein
MEFDAFGRLRTSGTGQRFDVEFIYDKQPDLVDEIIAGSGTVTHNANPRDLTLATGGTTTGDSAEMRSHPVPYTPGNSQLVDMTGVLDLAAIGSGTAQVFLRTKISGSVTETVVDQSSWNGTDVSDVDWTKSQLFSISFQSLKVGSIHYSLGRAGKFVEVHRMDHDNVRDSGYWQLPSLPLYWKIYNDATYTYMEVGYGDDNNAVGFRYRIAKNASATMKAICGTVKSEGGLSLYDLPGLARVADTGVTKTTVSTAVVPIISIQLKSTFKTFPNLTLVHPVGIGIETDNPIRLLVYHDTTPTTPSFTDVDTNESAVEYDVTATAFTGGHIIFSEYIGAGRNTSLSLTTAIGKIMLWNKQSTVSGVTGTLTIAAIRTGASDADVLASIKFNEIR